MSRIMTDREIVTETLRGYSTEEITRCYTSRVQANEPEWELREVLKGGLLLELFAGCSIEFTPEEARGLSILFKHYAEHETLPAPSKQEPWQECTT